MFGTFLDAPLPLMTSVDRSRYRDTVNSVGLIPRRLPFTTSNTIVHTFRHAVSLDERRAKFKANLWNKPTAKEASLGVEGQKPQVSAENSPSGPVSSPPVKGMLNLKKNSNDHSLRAMEKKYGATSRTEKPTDIEEVRLSLVVGTRSGL